MECSIDVLQEIETAEARASARLLQSRLVHARKLRAVFDLVDTDGSGQVDREECAAWQSVAVLSM